MRSWIKRVGLLLFAVVLMLPISIVVAGFAQPATIVSGLTEGGATSSYYGITWQPDDQTFYAKGRHWIFYDNDDTDIAYRTALDNGAFDTETELVASTSLYGWEFAVFYDETNDRVHVARHNLTPAPDEVQYRMGTPNTDGTITWAAAWQTVSTVPAVLNNWRTTICVDEEGYPWVAWIDTDGTNTFGVVYVENSTTKNGTWTEGTQEIFGAGGTATNGTGTMSGSPVTLDVGLNQPTVTVAGTFTIHLNQGETGTATSGGWTITGSPVALTEGDNVITVEAGGAGTIDLDLNERFAWFIGLTPVDSDKQIQVAWSWEDTSGGANDGEMGLQSALYDDDTGWDATQEVLPIGELYETRPDAFDFYDLGSAMYVAYTDDLGVVTGGVRSQIQNWAEATWGVIKSAALPYYPTLSGYQANAGGVGDDLICIMHCDVEIGYMVHTYGDDIDEWSDWVTAWAVPTIADDTISRHIATYKYSSPLGFAWQWNDDSAGTDSVMYWWIEDDQLGWYNGGLPDNVEPLANAVPLIFIMLAILVLAMLAFSDSINLKMLIYMAIAIFVIMAFLAMMNTQINTF